MVHGQYLSFWRLHAFLRRSWRSLSPPSAPHTKNAWWILWSSPQSQSHTRSTRPTVARWDVEGSMAPQPDIRGSKVIRGMLKQLVGRHWVSGESGLFAINECPSDTGDRHQIGRIRWFNTYLTQHKLTTGIEPSQSLKVLEHMLGTLTNKVLPVL